MQSAPVRQGNRSGAVSFHRESVEETREALLEQIVAVASGGVQTAAENCNDRLLKSGMPFLHHGFMPWKRWADN